MKNQSIKSLRSLTAFLGLCALFAFTGCASNFNQRAQHADGLGTLTVDVLGHGHRDVAKIEIIPGTNARILTAHAVENGDTIRVYGTLQPLVNRSRGSGAHVHVLLIGADGKAMAHGTDIYLVTANSLRLHGAPQSRARFSVTLPIPSPSFSVRLLHHGSSAVRCAETPSA